MCDNVAGVEHFKTTVEKGLEIVKGLRGWTSGLAVPHFVIDAPGGGGKVPLLPEYVEQITDTEIVLRNYKGDRYVWTQPREEALVGSGVHEPEYGFLGLRDGAESVAPATGNGRRAGGRRAPRKKRS
jgi:hypothetical protein